MATVLFFGPARDATGAPSVKVEGASVGEIIAVLLERYGAPLASIMPTCRIWVNAEGATDDTAVGVHDEVAVLPPVSGG